jgi:hypothetical protein
LTPAFEAALLHCLQKLPDDRPATGELLSQELATLLPATLETSAYRTRFTGSEPTVIVRTESQSHPGIATNGTEPAKRSRAIPWIVGAAALTVISAVSIRFFGLSRDPVPLPSPPTIDSAVAVAPPTVVPTVPPVVVDSATRRDTAVPAVPLTGILTVSAPENATISVNDREMRATGGTWRADTTPGQYKVTATVAAPAGCPTASATATRPVRRGRTTRISLTPRTCGTLSFEAVPTRGARWQLVSLTPSDSLAAFSGAVPAQNLVLPVGDYVRKIQAPKCADYADTVTVTPGAATHPRRQLLIC